MTLAKVTLALVAAGAIALNGHAQNVGNWSMSGRVVDAATGRPIARAPVTAALDSQLERKYYTTSDEHGAYHFERMQSGSYFVYVAVTYRTVDPSWKLNHVIDVTLPGERSSQTVSPIMDVGGKYRLEVEPAALVSLIRGQSFTFATTFHPSATSPDSARRVVIDAGQSRPGTDIGVRRVPSRRVTGIVAGPKFRRPDGPGEVLVLRNTDHVRFDLWSASTLTQEGPFVFMSVPPGTYTIEASEGVHGDMGGTLHVRMPNALTVGDADVSGVTVTVPVR
jgi:hypothetical protein